MLTGAQVDELVEHLASEHGERMDQGLLNAKVWRNPVLYVTYLQGFHAGQHFMPTTSRGQHQ